VLSWIDQNASSHARQYSIQPNLEVNQLSSFAIILLSYKDRNKGMKSSQNIPGPTHLMVMQVKDNSPGHAIMMVI